jgi:hypothetical protein
MTASSCIKFVRFRLQINLALVTVAVFSNQGCGDVRGHLRQALYPLRSTFT